MENDNYLINRKQENQFNFHYIGEKFENNLAFLAWEKEMLKKYGNNAKLFKCKMDKILFFVSNEEYTSEPLYSGNCPICNENSCYFCSRNGDDRHGYCCISRKIRYIFFNVNIVDRIDWDKDLSFFFPYSLFFMTFVLFSKHLFYALNINDTLYAKKGLDPSNILKYETIISKIFLCLAIINVLMGLFLAIPYVVIISYFNILVLIISPIFKNYPLKYLLGFFRRNDIENT